MHFSDVEKHIETHSFGILVSSSYYTETFNESS